MKKNQYQTITLNEISNLIIKKRKIIFFGAMVGMMAGYIATLYLSMYSARIEIIIPKVNKENNSRKNYFNPTDPINYLVTYAKKELSESSENDNNYKFLKQLSSPIWWGKNVKLNGKINQNIINNYLIDEDDQAWRVEFNSSHVDDAEKGALFAADFIAKNLKRLKAQELLEGLNRSYEVDQLLLRQLNNKIKQKNREIKELIDLKNEYSSEYLSTNLKNVNIFTNAPIDTKIQNILIDLIALKKEYKKIIAENNLINIISYEKVNNLNKIIVDSHFDSNLLLEKLKISLNGEKLLDATVKDYYFDLNQSILSLDKRYSRAYMTDIEIVKNYNLAWLIVRAGLVGLLLTLVIIFICMQGQILYPKYFSNFCTKLNLTHS